MGVFSAIFEGMEKRGFGLGAWENYLDNLGGRETQSGINVTEETVLEVTPALCAIRLLAEGIARLPCILYRRLPDDGRERAVNHPLYAILKRQPNHYQTAFTFWEFIEGCLAIRGNAYSQIIRNSSGEIMNLYALHPGRMNFDTKSGKLIWIYQQANGTEIRFNQNEIFNIPAFGGNGITGYSPVTLAREAIAWSKATELYGCRYFKNNARPSGVLEYPGFFKDKEKRKEFLASWQEAQTGSNQHKTAILENGMKWSQIGFNNEDSQFLESRKFSVSECARIWNVPPHKLKDLDRATFSNIEEQNLEFVIDTLFPWMRRIELSIEMHLLSKKEQEIYFVEFLVDSLLRGSIKDRYEAYRIGREGGWLSVNDVRRRENMNPLPPEIGDKYMAPLNYTTADKLGQDTKIINEKDINKGDNKKSRSVALLALNDAFKYHTEQIRSLEEEKAELLKRLELSEQERKNESEKVSEAIRIHKEKQEELQNEIEIKEADRNLTFRLSLEPIFTDAIRRLDQREIKAVRRAAGNKKMNDFTEWTQNYFGENEAKITRDILYPFMQTYASICQSPEEIMERMEKYVKSFAIRRSRAAIEALQGGDVEGFEKSRNEWPIVEELNRIQSMEEN